MIGEATNIYIKNLSKYNMCNIKVETLYFPYINHVHFILFITFSLRSSRPPGGAVGLPQGAVPEVNN